MDKRKADGSYPIYFFLRVGAKTMKIPSGKSVMSSEWNRKENTAKSNSSKGIALASYLNKRINDFNAHMLSQEAMGKQVTVKLAMAFFDTPNKADFYTFWNGQIRLYAGEKKYNTLKSYLTTYRILQTISPTLSFGDIDYAFLEKFDRHMATVRKNSAGGRFTKHKVLRAMINQAVLKKYMKENPYKYFKFKPAKGNRMFLSIQEVEKVIKLELPPDSGNLNHARDMFVFSCLTGLRFSDVVGLKYRNIKTNPDRIELTMEKTSKSIVIPVLPKAKVIVNRYRKNCIPNEDKNVFPNIANATINSKLKDLMKLAGIKKHISFHCARHTFATSLLHSKTSLPHLQMLLGHSNIQDTMIYAKTLQEDIFASMDNLNTMYAHQEAV
ncbi:tyrosine-type recombinase/integrase [Parapedobacter sp. 2B3]|uniref:tyrosine-type recombinase/integrase n=1 Tax=Parapedobacter sp. 2B3 TaxID=3342381 RepID=UPI0035B68331